MREFIIQFDTDEPLSELASGTTVMALAKVTGDCNEIIRCKDCKYYREDGDCWHEWDNDGRIYYQSVINEPNADDYCSKAVRKEE